MGRRGGGGYPHPFFLLLGLLVRERSPLSCIVLPSLLALPFFSYSVIQKRVYTFHFDRLSKESSDPVKVTELVQKMDRARKERAVVCSTPEAVKSVMLK